MTDGRTVWWAKDAAWWRRDGVLELLDDIGVVGPAIVDWLACEAKAQNAAGAVKSSYRAVAKGLNLELSTVCPLVSRCVQVGLLDDFEESGSKFTCRISGWKYEQDKAIAAAKKARQRAGSQVSSGGQTDPCPDASPSVPTGPQMSPTGQDRTGQVKNNPPTPQGGIQIPDPPVGKRGRDLEAYDSQIRAVAVELLTDVEADDAYYAVKGALGVPGDRSVDAVRDRARTLLPAKYRAAA